jgi:signal transduction histidine kinase
MQPEKQIANGHATPSDRQDEQKCNDDLPLDDLDQCILFNRDLLHIQEVERQRIAKDLHDIVGQALLTVKLELNMMFMQHPELGDLQGVAPMREKLSCTIHKAIRSVRDITYALRPPDLDQLGLPLAISALCTDFTERCGLETDYLSAGLDRIRLDFEIETHLYRLAQEALNNVEKHAMASKVMIRLVTSHPNVILHVADNGKGFEAARAFATPASEKSLGLWGMRQRAKLLGGKIRVHSTPGGGTSLVAQIPYTRGAHRDGLAHTAG